MPHLPQNFDHGSNFYYLLAGKILSFFLWGKNQKVEEMGFFMGFY
jgi:hypothetical protein